MFFTKLKSFVNFLRIFGFFSVSFDGHGNMKLRMFDRIVLMLKALLSICFIVTNFYHPITEDCCDDSVMLTVAWKIINLTEDFLVPLLFLHQWSKYDEIIGFYSHLDKIDNRVTISSLNR